ncbi:hypothetical protein CLAIMM_02909 [Cladophialophora immunda]|nr:hypothetical protein CLAIMM_02909 [Cladophialophora immunda]
MATQNVASPVRESTGSGTPGSKRKQSDTGINSSKKPKSHSRETDAQQGSLQQASLTSSKSKGRKKTIYNVLVSLDPGTEFCKAAICVLENTESPEKIDLKRLEKVKFPDGNYIARSQVAFKNMARNRQPIRIPLFGHEVDKALENNEIEAHEVIRYLKPMIYKGQMAAQRKTEDEISQLQGLMENLHFKMKQNLSAVGEFGTSHQLDESSEERKGLQSAMAPLEVFAQLLRWLLQIAIKWAIDNHPELEWPSLERPSDLDRLLAKARNIHIAVAIPADCSTIHKQHILAAAKSAGIREPWPYLVSEPAAALEYYVATLRHKKLSPQNSYMLVDIGGGSVDMQVWSIESKSPSKVTEMLPAVTEWVGGSEVNRDAVACVMRAIPDLGQMLREIRETRISEARLQVQIFRGRVGAPGPESVKKIERRGLTRTMLKEEIAEAFEQEKRHPANTSARLLTVKGVPFIRASMFCGGFGIRLKEENMKKVYKRSLDAIILTITRTLHHLADAKKRAGKQALPVDEILVCGGASSNLHVQAEIRKAVNDSTDHLGSKPFPVYVNFLVAPGDQYNVHFVALGGLLLLANHSAPRTRMMQREYFTWAFQDNDHM